MLKRLVICSLLLVLNSRAVEIIAHRGASYDAPENTLASVNLGWQRGADAVEVDVYLSKDGKIVALHDKNTKRTTGHNGLVHELTWDQLRKLDAGSWKNKKYQDEPIPLLSQILETIPKGKYLVIEIKCGPEIIEPLARLLKRTRTAPANTSIISFSYEVVAAAKKRFPQRRVYYLSAIKLNGKTQKLEPSVASLIKKAADVRLDGLSLGFSGKIDEPRLMRYVGQMRKETTLAKQGFYVWTINDLRRATKLAQAGVDGITTDRPAFLSPVRKIEQN